MADFYPEDMLQVVLEPRSEIVSNFIRLTIVQSLHEDAPDESIYMRGAYFVNAPPGTPKKDKIIDFFVLDPSYKVVFSRRKHDEGIFRFNTTKQGQYTFVFSNMKDRVNMKTVTLAIHPGKESEETKTLTQLEKERKEDEEMASAAGVDVSEIQHLE